VDGGSLEGSTCKGLHETSLQRHHVGHLVRFQVLNKSCSKQRCISPWSPVHPLFRHILQRILQYAGSLGQLVSLDRQGLCMLYVEAVPGGVGSNKASQWGLDARVLAPASVHSQQLLTLQGPQVPADRVAFV